MYKHKNNLKLSDIKVQSDNDGIFEEEIKVDYMIFEGLDKFKKIFKNDSAINVLNQLKVPFGIVIINSLRLVSSERKRILTIKKIFGSNYFFVASAFTLNSDWRRFLKDNNINFISNFMQKLEENF